MLNELSPAGRVFPRAATAPAAKGGFLPSTSLQGEDRRVTVPQGKGILDSVNPRVSRRFNHPRTTRQLIYRPGKERPS